MRKLITLAILIVSALSLFACRGNAPSVQTEGTPAQTQEPTTTAAAEDLAVEMATGSIRLNAASLENVLNLMLPVMEVGILHMWELEEELGAVDLWLYWWPTYAQEFFGSWVEEVVEPVRRLLESLSISNDEINEQIDDGLPIPANYISAHSWIDDFTEKLLESVERLIDDFNSELWTAFWDEFEYLTAVLFSIKTSDEWRILAGSTRNPLDSAHFTGLRLVGRNDELYVFMRVAPASWQPISK
jgi:hypothetical protein